MFNLNIETFIGTAGHNLAVAGHHVRHSAE